jgi:hypothetical protein
MAQFNVFWEVLKIYTCYRYIYIHVAKKKKTLLVYVTVIREISLTPRPLPNV